MAKLRGIPILFLPPKKPQLDSFFKIYISPHMLWYGIHVSRSSQGWGTHPNSYVNVLNGSDRYFIRYFIRNWEPMLYSEHDREEERSLNGFTRHDYDEILARGRLQGDPDYKWDCGFELSPGGLIKPSENLEIVVKDLITPKVL